MRRIRMVGAPLGVAVGVVTGAERERAGLLGRGTAEFGPCMGGQHVPEFWMRVRFFQVLPGVAVVYGDQRDRVAP